MIDLEELFSAIVKGNKAVVAELVQKAVDEKMDLLELLMGTMIPAMKEIGDRFARNEVYVPDMLIAARAMQAGLDIVEPILVGSGHEPAGKVCIATVKGDLHDIGKNLVVMMLKGAGYDVTDLGVDCDVNKYQKGIEESGAKILGCSALLTTTMPYMKEVIKHFKDQDVSVILGGAPVTQEYADDIGASGYAINASVAVDVVNELTGKTA